jgi:hypothetical protein
MGLNLSLGNLVLGGFIGLIGVSILIYGRKEVRVPHIVTGLIMIVYPYFVGYWWLEILICVVLLAGLTVVSRLGY